jgi:hypothetical protein
LRRPIRQQLIRQRPPLRQLARRSASSKFSLEIKKAPSSWRGFLFIGIITT